jgi:hypothetical protein
LPIPSKIQGQSLKEAIFYGGKKDRAAVIEIPLLWYAYRTPEWKVILDMRRERRYLFKLRDDPAERNNLAEKMPSKADEMLKLLGVERRVEEVPKRKGRDFFSAHIKERLKALGYLK